jgi:excinuclease UvrABC nuclease subunit
MNRCLRPCQQAVSPDEYRHEAERVEQFLRSGGASLSIPAEAARDRASTALEFEEAERLHQRLTRINEVTSAAGDLARTLDQLCGVAVAPSSESGCVELLFLAGGVWQDPRRLTLGEAGQSMDTRLRELTSGITAAAAPNLEHLSLLMRWYGSSWRDGEWISFESLEKIPYRKIVNAVSRVSRTGL